MMMMMTMMMMNLRRGTFILMTYLYSKDVVESEALALSNHRLTILCLENMYKVK